MIITFAAIQYQNGEVLEAHSYGAVEHMATILNFSGERTYGFTNSVGEFMSPKEAGRVAFKANQINELKEDLAPEDLWPMTGDELAY